MADARDFDPGMDMDRRIEMERRMGSPTHKGWIAGAVFVLGLLALSFPSSEGTRTAREELDPPATMGMAPKTVPLPTAALRRGPAVGF